MQLYKTPPQKKSKKQEIMSMKHCSLLTNEGIKSFKKVSCSIIVLAANHAFSI